MRAPVLLVVPFIAGFVHGQTCGAAGGQPAVTLNAPAQGATQLSGSACNFGANDKIVIYALTNEFYVQPLADAPFTNIAADGSWSSLTNPWQTIVVLLVDPANYMPQATEITNPVLDPGVLAWTEYPTAPVSINFSGRTWGIKVTGNAPTDQFNPGPNFFSSNTSVVNVAADGLHLNNAQVNGNWQSAEVYLLQSLGYGTYTVQVGSPLDHLDPNTVAAPLFIYAGTNQELDNEYSGAGGLIPSPYNAQFVVQPYTVQGNLAEYVQPSTGQFTSQMEWQADHVTFTAWNNWSSVPAAGDIIYQWTYTGTYIPPPGQERVHINLWLLNGNAPVSGTGDSMVINSFTFQPAQAATCTYSVVPGSLGAPAAGGSFPVAIQTAAGCVWAVAGLPSWITVSGASSGSGPGNVTLVVAPNTSATSLSATITIAGAPFTVTQAAAPSGCTYALNPGGETFPAVGANGIISVTAAASCSWTATSSLSWVTITSANSGTGNGSITFQVAANTGGDRTGSIVIGGQSFDIEQPGASISGFTSSGSMAQLAFNGGWVTEFTLINTGSAPAQIRLNFFDNNGNPLALPLLFPQSPMAAGPLEAITLDRTINPGAGLVIQTQSLPSQTTQVGWAQLLWSGNIGGFAVFQQTVPLQTGLSVQQAVSPLETANPNAFEIWYDNTAGNATGIALANVGSQAVNVPLIIHDDTGAVLLSTTLALPAEGHTSFNLAQNYPVAAGVRGTVELDTPSGGQISALGLTFNPTGAFSSVPPVTK